MRINRMSASFLLVGVVVTVSWIIGVAVADNREAYRLKGTDICIPEAHAESLLPAAGFDSGDYDVSKGYDVAATISRQELGQSIKGYKETVVRGGRTKYLGVLLSLYPASETSREIEAPEALTQVKQAPDLFIQNYVDETYSPMDVFRKKSTGGYRLWGYCSLATTNNSPKRLECERQYLNIGPLLVSYDIDEANLHLYKEVDEFVRKKLRQWRCEG